MALWTGFANGALGGRMLGIGLGLAAIGHLWWYKTASLTDATECP